MVPLAKLWRQAHASAVLYYLHSGLLNPATAGVEVPGSQSPCSCEARSETMRRCQRWLAIPVCAVRALAIEGGHSFRELLEYTQALWFHGGDRDGVPLAGISSFTEQDLITLRRCDGQLLRGGSFSFYSRSEGRCHSRRQISEPHGASLWACMHIHAKFCVLAEITEGPAICAAATSYRDDVASFCCCLSLQTYHQDFEMIKIYIATIFQMVRVT